MSNPQHPYHKLPSLADYLLRYDLAEILAEAQLDYNQSKTAGPRLLDQKEIAARFSRLPKAKPEKPSHEQG
jgi:hypothetical protein